MKHLFVIFAVVLFYSCDNTPKIVDESQIVEINYLVCYKETEKPFTGTVIYGGKKKERNYVNGIEEGMSYEYYPSGSVEWEWSYKNGLLEGTTTHYYEDGKKSSESIYKDGMEVKYTSYDKNGDLKRITNYFNGKVHGKSIYYLRGKLYEEVTYENDQRNGLTTRYHDNGQIKETQEYKNSKKHGKYIGYSETGEITYELDYEDGYAYKDGRRYN